MVVTVVVGVSVVVGITVEGSSVVVIGASRLVVISSVELIGSSVVGVSVVAKIILEWLAPSRTDNNKTEDRDFLKFIGLLYKWLVSWFEKIAATVFFDKFK